MGNGMLKGMPRVAVLLVATLMAACGGGGGGGGSTTTPPTAVSLTSLAPAGVNAGAGATVLTATGSGFTTASVVEWNGTPLPTSYVSATSVTATIPATDLTAPGSVPVTVSNTGGASSGVVDFAISEQTAPTVATLSPASLIVSSQSIILTVTGTNFLPTATVLWNGTPLATTFQSNVVLTAVVTGAQIATAGTASVAVANDAASGGTSNAATIIVTPAPPGPTLTSLAPTSIRQNQGGVILTLTGTNFTPTAQAIIGQNPSFTTSYVSPTELTVTFTTNALYAAAGTSLNVVVADPASGYQNSNALQLTVTAAVPTVTGISPSSVYANQGSLALTLSGQYFTATSVAYVNGSARPTTVNVNNNGQLVAQLRALDVATAGTAVITVEDPASGNVASNSTSLTIQPLPSLGLSSVSPAAVPAGYGAFTLTVSGNGFAADSVIQWNGTTLITTHVSVTTLTAPVAAAQVASIGTAQVTVVNPVGEGGTSPAQTVSIVAPSKDAVSYQINNGHSGNINFQTVVATLPSSPAWSVNVGGTPSYAVIAANRVFVAAATSSGSQLFAFDAATGAILWGPEAYAGTAGITYDNGTLFVSNGLSTNSGVLTAVDAATGNPKWNVAVPGYFSSQSPPVASEGIVYMLDDGIVTAFNETNGATAWQGIATGTNGSVAVSLDGVYTAAPCIPTDFQPVTGTTIWTTNTGCEGGGGNTPVIAAGRVYAPIGGVNYAGTVYDAESGLVLGSFGYSAPPAVTSAHVYTLYNSILESVTLSNNQVNWSFTGDGSLNTAPIVVNNYVFVGSSSGNLYGLDATTGNKLWTQSMGAAIPGAPVGPGGVSTGLAAGDGLLVVPAGNTITAFVLSTNP